MERGPLLPGGQYKLVSVTGRFRAKVEHPTIGEREFAKAHQHRWRGG